MDETKPPKAESRPKPDADTRESRLAAALRANLRRRKAAEKDGKKEG